MLDGAVDPGALEAACGPDPSFICRVVLERADSRGLAEAADIAFARPVKILVVIVAAWVVLRIVHRLIREFVANLSGQGHPGRRIKRRLRRPPLATATLPEGAQTAVAVSTRASARAETLGHVLWSVSAFAVWGIAIITVLGELGINLGPLVAGAGIAGVALGFGAQSLVKDFLAGIFILVEDQYGVGDTIDVGELSGTLVSGAVEAVTLRSTKLRAANGTVFHVPNGTILRVGNMSKS